MNPQSAIAKGKELENWIVERLKITGLDIRATRNPGSGNGLMKGDVNNDLNLAIEAKNTAKPNLGPSLKQTARQALGIAKPVMVWHMPRTPMEDSKVIIDWSYFEELLLKTKQPTTVNPDRAFTYKLERVKQSVHDLLKEIT